MFPTGFLILSWGVYMLNPESPVPLYHQLADILVGRIRSGEYGPGERIPSEPVLSRDYGIGRPTVRQAIDLLVRRKMLYKRRGAGTFVSDERKEVNLFSLAGTTSAFFETGKEVQTRLIDPTRLAQVKNDPENPFNGEQAFFYSRLTLVDKLPVLIEEMFLHPLIFKDFDTLNMEGRSLAETVRETYYMIPENCRQRFRVISIDEEKAHWLSVPEGSPILLVLRHLNFRQGENAIFSKLFCNTDTFVFSQVIEGNPDD